MMTDSFLDYLRFEKNYSEKTIVSYGIDLISLKNTSGEKMRMSILQR